MTSYQRLSLILLIALFQACFPHLEQSNPILLDVGKTEFGYYHNQYFGYSMRIPDGWAFHEAKELYADSESYTIEDVVVVDSVSEKAQQVRLGGMLKEKDRSLNFEPAFRMQADYVGDFTIPEERELAQQILDAHLQTFPNFQVIDAYRKPINGRFYYIWEGNVSEFEGEYTQAIYLILTKDKTYGLSFILTYQDQQDQQVLSEMIQHANWRIRD